MAAKAPMAPTAAPPGALMPLQELRPSSKNVHCQFIVLVKGARTRARLREELGVEG